MFERVETERLVLRKPERADAQGIFTRYASDPQVTRLLAWPRHESLEATREFLDLSDAQWSGWPVGPYLVESRQDGTLLGGTGLAFEAKDRAMTGYVLSRNAWGKGYATESLRAVLDVARRAGAIRIYALCHPDNYASQHVLAKCGFSLEGLLREHSRFPNLACDQLFDVLSYSIDLAAATRA